MILKKFKLIIKHRGAGIYSAGIETSGFATGASHGSNPGTARFKPTKTQLANAFNSAIECRSERKRFAGALTSSAWIFSLPPGWFLEVRPKAQFFRWFVVEISHRTTSITIFSNPRIAKYRNSSNTKPNPSNRCVWEVS